VQLFFFLRFVEFFCELTVHFVLEMQSSKPGLKFTWAEAAVRLPDNSVKDKLGVPGI